MKYDYDIFLICPVSGVTLEQKTRLEEHLLYLEEVLGKKVYYPARDTNQNDVIGWDICCANELAMRESKEVYIFWSNTSKGSLFDLGMAKAMKKRLHVLNIQDTLGIEKKSFERMIRYWGWMAYDQELE